MTKQEVLWRIPFYSIDSTTVLSCVRFGQYFGFTGAFKLGRVRWNSPKDRVINFAVRNKVPLSLMLDSPDKATAEIHQARVLMMARIFQTIETRLTALWKVREVDWAAQVGESGS